MDRATTQGGQRFEGGAGVFYGRVEERGFGKDAMYRGVRSGSGWGGSGRARIVFRVKRRHGFRTASGSRLGKGRTFDFAVDEKVP